MDVPDNEHGPVQHVHVNEFVEAMRTAFLQGAPVRDLRSLVQEAPHVPIEGYPRLLVDALRVLLRHEPEIAKLKNPYKGRLLLHIASSSEVSNTEAIQLILDANPDAIFEKGGDGYLPFHLACVNEISIESLELLFRQCPDAASIPGGPGGDLPIHWVLYFPIHWMLKNVSAKRFILRLLDAVPGASSVMGSGELPLHIACQQYYYSSEQGDFSFEIVKRLVDLYPEGLTIQDDNGNLPIHQLSPGQPLSLDVVKFLLDGYPEGIRTTNARGELPLHRALCKDQAPLQLIEYLIEQYPEAANTTDDDGNLPLHRACSIAASHDVLQLLPNCYTGDERNHSGLSVANNTGWLPLHCYAMSHGSNTSAFQHLLALYPQGIHVAASDGRLPLHVACNRNHPRLNVIRLLVEEDLYIVVKKCQHGTPYQIACGEEYRNVDVEAYLFEKQNEAVARLKDACEDVGATQLGLQDLVVAQIWSFAKPDLLGPDDDAYE